MLKVLKLLESTTGQDPKLELVKMKTQYCFIV